MTRVEPRIDQPETPASLAREGWIHMRLQRPLAAWAAWNRALRENPNDQASLAALRWFEHSAPLPPIARGPHRFLSPASDLDRDRWNARLSTAGLDDLERAEGAFAALAAEDPRDTAAMHNRALCLAWLGRNLESIAELDRVVRLDATSERARPDAVRAWMLAEVLRQGAGAEQVADDLHHLLEITWPGALGNPLAWLEQHARLQGVVLRESANSDPVEIQEWLSNAADSPPAANPDALELPRVRASVLPVEGRLRFASPSLAGIQAVESDLKSWLGEAFCVLERRSTPLPIELADLDARSFRIPCSLDPQRHAELACEGLARYYEHDWVEIPRWGLAERHGTGAPPRSPREVARLSGSDRPVAHTRLEAIIAVREQLAKRAEASASGAGYDFDRLRRLLNLE